MQQARRQRLLCSVSVCVTVRLQTRRYAACSDHRGRYAACVSLGEPLRGIRYRLAPESGRFSCVKAGKAARGGDSGVRGGMHDGAKKGVVLGILISAD